MKTKSASLSISMTPASVTSKKSSPMQSYQDFLASKVRVFEGNGQIASSLPPQLFDWQARIVRWALRKGRAAIFADCGLGKSFMQLAWAEALQRRTLIFAPLCVAEQTIKEGRKLGIAVSYAHDQHEADRPDSRLVITNYERLEKFDPSAFDAIVLDESSILKAMDGKTRTRLIQQFGRVKYRLCCTATPSPNDIAELANHSEFLGLMTRPEFLATWFVHDNEGWRMKRHAIDPFHRWLASWAIALRSPADLGADATGFDLPPLRIHETVIESSRPADGMLFADMAVHGIGGRLRARRAGWMIAAFQKEGWIYHGECCIDKDPQAQAIRTHSKGLLFVQLRRDASWLRPALADYILVFRNDGENAVPIHPDLTNEEWIEWARPIWYGIRESDTLNVAIGRDAKDERHICPLQLGTIERCVRLWSNPSELILSPFAGIGSEGYEAVRLGRRYLGIELKESYYAAACKNLYTAETLRTQGSLLEAMA